MKRKPCSMSVGSIEHEGDTFRIHAHVISLNSPEAEGFRWFRDRLRGDASLRDAYVACKKEIIARGVVDPVDYSIEKGDFIKDALSPIWDERHKRACQRRNARCCRLRLSNS